MSFVIFVERAADRFLAEIEFFGNFLNRNIPLSEADDPRPLCWCSFSRSVSSSLNVDDMVLRKRCHEMQ
jgi:hypothetical protein